MALKTPWTTYEAYENDTYASGIFFIHDSQGNEITTSDETGWSKQDAENIVGLANYLGNHADPVKYVRIMESANFDMMQILTKITAHGIDLNDIDTFLKQDDMLAEIRVAGGKEVEALKTKIAELEEQIGMMNDIMVATAADMYEELYEGGSKAMEGNVQEYYERTIVELTQFTSESVEAARKVIEQRIATENAVGYQNGSEAEICESCGFPKDDCQCEPDAELEADFDGGFE